MVQLVVEGVRVVVVDQVQNGRPVRLGLRSPPNRKKITRQQGKVRQVRRRDKKTVDAVVSNWCGVNDAGDVRSPLSPFVGGPKMTQFRQNDGPS